MFEVIIVIFVTISCLLQLICLYVLNNKLKNLQVQLNNVTTNEFKYKNIYYMVEYYVRNYNENKNIKSLVTNLNNLIYKTGEYNGKK